jgi:hypothetical protein
VVDFVLVLVVLIPLFLGILQLGLVLHVRNTLASAAAAGARQAATVGSSPAQGEATAREQVAGGLTGRFADRISVVPVSIGGAPAYEVRIAADVPALGLGGPAIHLEVSGNAVREEVP